MKAAAIPRSAFYRWLAAACFVGWLFTTYLLLDADITMRWAHHRRDLDFEAGEIVVRGDPETGTKNWTVRRVPMMPDARPLFERMRGERVDEPLTGNVFRVQEAQKATTIFCSIGKRNATSNLGL